MISRKITIFSKNNGFDSPVRKFVEGIYAHPMYKDVVQQLFESNGFIKKINTMEENKEQCQFVIEIQFADKESFDAYFNEPSIESLYNYLEVIITSDNVEFNSEIIED